MFRTVGRAASALLLFVFAACGTDWSAVRRPVADELEVALSDGRALFGERRYAEARKRLEAAVADADEFNKLIVRQKVQGIEKLTYPEHALLLVLIALHTDDLDALGRAATRFRAQRPRGNGPLAARAYIDARRGRLTEVERDIGLIKLETDEDLRFSPALSLAKAWLEVRKGRFDAAKRYVADARSAVAGLGEWYTADFARALSALEEILPYGAPALLCVQLCERNQRCAPFNGADCTLACLEKRAAWTSVSPTVLKEIADVCGKAKCEGLDQCLRRAVTDAVSLAPVAERSRAEDRCGELCKNDVQCMLFGRDGVEACATRCTRRWMYLGDPGWAALMHCGEKERGDGACEAKKACVAAVERATMPGTPPAESR